MKTYWRACCALCTILILNNTTYATTIEFNPIRLDFHQRNIETIKLTNKDDKPVTVQLDVMLWQQTKQAEDKLTNTQDLLAAPSIVTIPAHTTQFVRIAKRFHNPAVDVKNYRLIVREIIDKAIQSERQNLKVALHASLPIFMQSLKEPPKYEHQVISQFKKSYLLIRNHSNRPILIMGYKVYSKNKNTLLTESKMFKYVFPHVQFQYPLPVEVPIEANVDLTVY